MSPHTPWVLLLAAGMLGAAGARGSVRCHNTVQGPGDGNSGDGATTTPCPDSDACFAQYETTERGLRAVFQGCFKRSSSLCDSATCVVSPKLFCCCSQDLCNGANATLPAATTPPPPVPDAAEPGGVSAIVVALVSLTVAAALLAALQQAHKRCRRKKGGGVVADVQFYPSIDTNKLMLIEQIGRGRYGVVWKALLEERMVAVKVTSLESRQNFVNERELYRLIAHVNVTRFLAAEERRGADGRPEFLVVMEYYEHGSLSNFLSDHASDWARSCRLAHSLTSGLAYLHSEILKDGHDGRYKPAIAHRDLNGRNVLVRADCSCVLSDLGLAMKLTRRSPIQRRAATSDGDDNSTICEVGTFRYMAPEVLDGAIDLTDYETALKQVDVYSLGLVYWEIFMRCRDLFPEGHAPAYAMALQAELGSHPAFEDVQHCVARERQRPKFPDAWRDDSFVISCLKAVIEECWEHDADARLTANCAEERLAELRSLRSPCPADPAAATVTSTETNNKINSLRGGQHNGSCLPDAIYIETSLNDSHSRAESPRSGSPNGSPCRTANDDYSCVVVLAPACSRDDSGADEASPTEEPWGGRRGSVPPANGTGADLGLAASELSPGDGGDDGGDGTVKMGTAGDAIYAMEGERLEAFLGSSSKSFHEMGLLMNGNQNMYAVY